MGRYALAVLVAGIAPCLAGAADGGYTGSRACAGCHRQIYERYASVAMSHSMSLANQAAPLGDGPVTVFSANATAMTEFARTPTRRDMVKFSAAARI